MTAAGLPLTDSALNTIKGLTFLMTLSVQPGGALPPPPTPLPEVPPLPPSAPAAARKRASWSARTFSAAALALTFAGESALGVSACFTAGFSGGGMGLGLTTSFTGSFFGSSFSNFFFLIAISAASSLASVLISGVAGVLTWGTVSHNSTSTPAGVELRHWIPIMRKASKPKWAMSENVSARLVLSVLPKR